VQAQQHQNTTKEGGKGEALDMSYLKKKSKI
jgi:hypothetical protein